MLTFPKREKPLDTFKELADSNKYEIYVPKGVTVTNYFSSSDNPIYQKIAKKQILFTRHSRFDEFIDKQNMVWLAVGYDGKRTIDFVLPNGKAWCTYKFKHNSFLSNKGNYMLFNCNRF